MTDSLPNVAPEQPLAPNVPSPKRHFPTPAFMVTMALLVGLLAGAAGAWYYTKTYLVPKISTDPFPEMVRPGTVLPVSKGYGIVPELGVRFKVPTADPVYTYVFKNIVDTQTNKIFKVAYFNSQRLKEAAKNDPNNSCAIAGSIGALSQYSKGDKIFDQPVEFIPAAMHIGAYYYLFEAPQAPCSASQAAQKVEVDGTQALSGALKTLELAN